MIFFTELALPTTVFPFPVSHLGGLSPNDNCACLGLAAYVTMRPR